MKIVVDTNVIEKALFWKDKWAREVLRGIGSGRFTGFVSIPIVDEYSLRFASVISLRTLDPAQYRPPVQAFARLLARFELIEVTIKCPISPDPDDNKFFECAITAGADFLVTQDGDHLLGLPNPPVPVVSPWQLMQRAKRR